MLLLLLCGCTYRVPYASSKPYYMVLKNSSLAVADTGFIKRDEHRFNLQLFSASTPVFELDVQNLVCLGYKCMTKKSFNREFFGFEHYDEFIEELVNLQPIYGKIDFIKDGNGFKQRIKTENYDITYRVDGGNLYFKDRKNRVLIKLKELK